MTVATAQPGKTRIGWIGTGVMGRWMCQHAMQQGLRRDGLQPQQGQGRSRCSTSGRSAADSPKQVAEQSDIVFAIVGFPKDVREVFLGADGALAGRKAGHGPRGHDDERAVAGEGDLRRGEGEGRARRSMPRCRGGDVGAKNAALSIMIGGDKEVVDAVQPVFEAMGKTIVHQGGPGAGQHTKMVNQILISSNMIAVCEGLLYGYKAGLDLETVFKSVSRRRGREQGAGSPRPADDGPQLRAGLLRRALHQGHGHRAGRGGEDEPVRCRGLAWRSSSTKPCGRRATAARGRRRCCWRWRR